MTTVGVFSARADGATTVAIGLAAVLAARARTLLIDLNLDNPEVATVLDLDPEVGVFDLAYKAQLAPVDREELEQHTGFRDRVAVHEGSQRDAVAGSIISGLRAIVLVASGLVFVADLAATSGLAGAITTSTLGRGALTIARVVYSGL